MRVLLLAAWPSACRSAPVSYSSCPHSTTCLCPSMWCLTFSLQIYKSNVSFWATCQGLDAHFYLFGHVVWSLQHAQCFVSRAGPNGDAEAVASCVVQFSPPGVETQNLPLCRKQKTVTTAHVASSFHLQNTCCGSIHCACLCNAGQSFVSGSR